MSYTVSLLTTEAECDSLLTIAAKEKSDLEFRTTSLTRQKENYSETSTTVDQVLLATNAEVAALQTVIANLVDGSTKDDQIAKLKRAELKQFLLLQKDKNYGSASVLILELDVNRNQKQLDEVNAFIATVEQRKGVI